MVRTVLSIISNYSIILVMKYPTFFLFLGLFIWVAVVPPEGMSKYPAVNVEFESGDQYMQMEVDMSRFDDDDSTVMDSDDAGDDE